MPKETKITVSPDSLIPLKFNEQNFVPFQSHPDFQSLPRRLPQPNSPAFSPDPDAGLDTDSDSQ